ncbi:MAG: pitrilysin family protein [Planctomycetota bacterium]
MGFLQTIPELREPAEGVELLCLPEPRFKRAQLSLTFDLPLDGGRAARTLLAEVLTQGTDTLPSRLQVTRALQDLYGANCSLYADRSMEYHRVTMNLGWVGDRFLPPEELVQPRLLGLARGLLDKPRRGTNGSSFDVETLERERSSALKRIRERKDDRSAYAEERFLEKMCDGEPYGLLPWESEQAVHDLTADALEAARLHLLKQAKITCIVVGPCDVDLVETWLKDWFGRRAPIAALPEIVHRTPGELREFREELPMEQAQFHYGYRFEQPQTPRAHEALGLACSILGGGAHGRLFRVVREEKSLAYGIYSMLRSQKGLMTVSAGIDADAYAEVRGEVETQLKDLQENGPTAEEIQFALVNRLDRLRGLSDSGARLANYHLREHWAGLRRTPAQRAEMLQDLKPDEIAEAARRFQADSVYLLAPSAELVKA